MPSEFVVRYFCEAGAVLIVVSGARFFVGFVWLVPFAVLGASVVAEGLWARIDRVLVVVLEFIVFMEIYDEGLRRCFE